MNESITLLRDARERAALTTAQLALTAGIDLAELAAYESGRREPSSQTLIRLLAATGFELELRSARRPLLLGTPLPFVVTGQRHQIVAVLGRFSARNPRVFGSRARGDARDKSDLDILIDLAPDMELRTFMRMDWEVEALTGIKGNVVAALDVAPKILANAEADAIPL